MAITSDQISLVLSGGSGNNDPKFSLGGQPSAFPITSGQLNNLFDDVTAEETSGGLDEYRCLYVFNDGLETVYNVKLWIDSQVEGGSDILIGAAEQDEVQRLTIRGTISAGTITLSYAGKTFTTNFDPSINIWAQNIEVSMNGLLDDESVHLLNDVTVTGQQSGTNRFFDITFTGIDGKRDHPMLLNVSNDLSPTPTQVALSLLLQGSPVNNVAPSVDVDTTPPGGVTFSSPTIDAPITIIKLGPSEGFPFWVKRTTQAGATALSRDAFVLKIRIESLNPIG
jgi:hypothetical protein